MINTIQIILLLFIVYSTSYAGDDSLIKMGSNCAKDVLESFDSLNFEKNQGNQIIINGMVSIGHYQGIARLKGPILAVSHTKGIEIIKLELPGNKTPTTAMDGSVIQHLGLPKSGDLHVGGLHGQGDILIVGSDNKKKSTLSFYKLSRSPDFQLILLRHFDTTKIEKKAHYVAAIENTSGTITVLTAWDNRQTFGRHRINFLNLNNFKDRPKLFDRWSRPLSKDFQSASLIKECQSGKIYFIGFGGENNNNRGYIRLYELQFKKNSVASRRKRSIKVSNSHGDCNLDGGSTMHVLNTGKLAFYCMEKIINGDKLTVREYISIANVKKDL